MAFQKSEMSLMAYTGTGTNGHRFWFYTNSGGDTLTATGYFNPFADQIVVGDLIYDVNGAQFLNVTSNTGGVVAVALV